MFTDEQLYRLTTINFVHEGLFEWVHKHTVEIPYKELTAIQRKTLLLIADMSKAEQSNYVIIDDKLVKTPTNVEYFSKLHGRWGKRQCVRVNTKRKK